MQNREQLSPFGRNLALGQAAIDIIYVLRRRILPVYLLDAVLELGMVVGWGVESRAS